jgi:hypothetical protein
MQEKWLLTFGVQKKMSETSFYVLSATIDGIQD